MPEEQQPKSTGLAAMDPKAYGVVPTNQALGKKDTNKKLDVSKFRELLGAIHDSAFPGGNVDDQTELEWDHIEGEVIGEVLQLGVIAGTPLNQINHPFFHFATPEECINKTFEKSLIDSIKKRQMILASFCAAKENLNRLMISFQRKGRGEQVQMLQSLSLSLSEQERSDPMAKIRRLG
jgi:hypothetical protein